MLSNLNKIAAVAKQPVRKQIVYGEDQTHGYQGTIVKHWFKIETA